MKDTIYYPMLDEIIRYAFEKQPAEFREWVEGCDAETTVVELLRDFGHEHADEIEEFVGGI